jgi:AcrR family transcriptional regulator
MLSIHEGYDNEVTSVRTEQTPDVGPAASRDHCAARTAPSAAGERAAMRRRGAALEDAILTAAYEELVDVGYTALSVEGVAARAGTGKASIYRRWPTKQHLVTDALISQLPTPAACGIMLSVDDIPDTVSTADLLYRLATKIAQMMASPAGQAMRAIKCEALADPELARLVDERFQAPRRESVLALLRRGVERGEVRPEAVNPLVADVLPAILTFRVLMQRERITRRDITAIMEQVLLPLVEAR